VRPDVATLLLPATSTGEPELPEAAFERSLAASVHCVRARRGTSAWRMPAQWPASASVAASWSARDLRSASRCKRTIAPCSRRRSHALLPVFSSSRASSSSLIQCTSHVSSMLGVVKGGATVCTRFTSVRPQYYPTALVATTTECPRTEQWMTPKGRERSMTYS